MSLRLASVVFPLLVVACDSGNTPIGGFEDTDCPSTADDGADGADDTAGPVAASPENLVVDCAFDFDGDGQTVRFEDEELTPAPVLDFGDLLHVQAHLHFAEFDSNSFSLSVYTDDGTVGASTLYQFGNTPPINEFFGQHGFTGLGSVDEPGTDRGLQYACFVRHPDDPLMVWED